MGSEYSSSPSGIRTIYSGSDVEVDFGALNPPPASSTMVQTYNEGASTSYAAELAEEKQAESNYERNEEETATVQELPIQNRPLFDGTFFSLVPEKTDGVKIVAKCVKCDQIKEIKGTSVSTSNFRSHIKRRHGVDMLEELNIHMKRNTKVGSDIRKPDKSAPKQSSIRIKFSQEQFSADVSKYIINSFAPLSTCENTDFRAIFDNLRIPNLKHISRRNLTRDIICKSKEMKLKIKKDLEKIDFICTTADVWSSAHRRFLGVTAHWINGSTYETKSIALACRRFPGTHSYDRLAEYLTNISNEFEINSTKIVATVTDNGSNFVKAFKEYGIVENEESIEEIEVNELPSLHQIGNLPPHIRCASHTLSLIATTDIPKAIKNSISKELYEEAIRKCSLLWHKSSSSPKTAEIIKEILGFNLKKPTPTRWNSLYDSIAAVLKAKLKFSILGQKLRIDVLNIAEVNHLEEFQICMQPLVNCLDRLQAEKNMHYGYLLPSLLELRKKVEKLLLNDENISQCKVIAQTLLLSLDTRFEKQLKLDGGAKKEIIAAFCHPVFKGRWLAALDVHHRERLRTYFISTVANEYEIGSFADPSTDPSSERKEDDFYFGDEDIDPATPSSSTELQVLKYLSDPRKDLSMLDNYPVLKAIFLKYNTPLPSSAPVERLFSQATILNGSKCGSLTDEHFEERVLLKANKYY